MSLEDLDPERLRHRLSVKWRHHAAPVLPAWVAEMDYPIAPAIRAVLQRALDLDDFGYPAGRDQHAVPEAFAERMRQRYGWSAEPARVEVLSDVMQGVYLALLAFTAPGDGVLVQTPIYPPFLTSVNETGRRLVASPLVDTGSHYGIDLDGLREQAPGVRALLLAHPHNPTGRCFTRAELEALAELALQHDWVVLSDEIHADLTHPGHTFLPFASLAPELAARTITFSSATKAFNIAGLRCALTHFGSAAHQARFNALVPPHARGGVGILSQHATVAAWRHGEPWLTEVRATLDARRHQLIARLAQQLPEAKVYLPEATYLAWLDLRALQPKPTAAEFFRRQAHVVLSDGAYFGDGYEGFARLNFATSGALLDEIIDRMAKVVRAGIA